IRAARRLEKSILSRRPDFDVVRFGRAESQIAGAKLNHSVMQTEQLQYPFRVRSKRFKFFVRFLRRCDFHQLDFVELMHANETTRVAPGGPSFAPETGRIGGEFFRKIAKAQDLLTMEIC